MLDELLKHNKLGNKEELLLFLFDGMSCEQIEASHIRSYCISKVFSIARSLDAIICLFDYLSFINIKDNKLQLNIQIFNSSKYSQDTYFSELHFYENLFSKLNESGVLKDLFDLDSIRFSVEKNSYYISTNKIPYRLFTIKNLLQALNFFEIDSISSRVYINTKFTSSFPELILQKTNTDRLSRKVSLATLKRINLKKELIGREAEQVVLQYEKLKMEMHPFKEKIRIISDESVNAGYDIESFLDEESVFINKYIEVKSYDGDDISFYWSKNEIETAKYYQERYFLYLVNRTRMSQKNYTPHIIQNPYLKIHNNNLWEKNPQTWLVTYRDK